LGEYVFLRTSDEPAFFRGAFMARAHKPLRTRAASLHGYALYPALPLHVHQGLGTFMVGLVSGSQFAASVVSRVGSGHYADRLGAKPAVVVGLLAATVSGLLYVLSPQFVDLPMTSAAVLLLGRALLGAAESFFITGALSSGLALVDPRNSGKVIAWIGTAMDGAFAVGAPIGSDLYAADGVL
jgi:MFS family permease